jgi:membrane protein implicated in regulation of membrane protease activity
MHHLLLVLPLFGFALFIFLRWQIALPLCVVILGVSLGVYWKVIQAQRRRPVIGKRAMIGDRAVVVRVGGDAVEVEYEGEIWRAVSPEPLHQGQQVIIEAVEGLALRVSPATDRRI